MSEQHRVFAHLDTPLAPLYRQVLGVFVANKSRFVVHLRPEDITSALRDAGGTTTQESVEHALASLREWGNLGADPDTSRVMTVQDFYRSRYLYQLSREGEAAERALEVFERELGRRGELQAIALEDVHVRLRALLALADQPDPDAAVVHNLLLELSARLDSLAANASAFMGSMQRTIDLHDVDEEAFLAYKDRLIAYLERFVSELVVKSFAISATLHSFTPVGIGRLLLLAAEREATDAAPADLSGGRDDRRTGAVAQRLIEWRQRWSGVQAWFSGDRVRPSQATLLRQRARKAIPELLATVSFLQERRAGRSDRSADYRELARWFAAAPSDADAHRLWRAAFGLATARHLTGSTTDAQPTATSWVDATPVEITPRLRATGHYQRRGIPLRVSDRSTARAHLADLVAMESAQTEAARARLATNGTRLSELGPLDPEEFALFLRLLGEALSAGPPGADGRIRVITADGSMEVELTALPGLPPARIETAEGVLWAPEHEIVIVDRLAAGSTPPSWHADFVRTSA